VGGKETTLPSSVESAAEWETRGHPVARSAEALALRGAAVRVEPLAALRVRAVKAAPPYHGELMAAALAQVGATGAMAAPVARSDLAE
jgi:hypothetical protein